MLVGDILAILYLRDECDFLLIGRDYKSVYAIFNVRYAFAVATVGVHHKHLHGFTILAEKCNFLAALYPSFIAFGERGAGEPFLVGTVGVHYP